MNRLLRPSLLVVLLAVCPAARGDVPPPSKFDPKTIDAFLEAQVRANGYVGLSVALVRDGKVVLAKGYGNRSLKPEGPVETSTMFAAGSVTKQFTAACVFLLQEDGKLSVRDPVAKWYPDLTRAKEITLYDLMTHAAGYPDYYPLDFVDRRMAKAIDPDQLLKEYAGGEARLRPGPAVVVQQHRVRPARADRREGQRQAVRRVPVRAHPEAARDGAHRLRPEGRPAGLGPGVHRIRPRPAGAVEARGAGLDPRGRRPVHDPVGPGEVGRGPRLREGAQAGVVPPHDHAAGTGRRPVQGLRLRDRRQPAARGHHPQALRGRERVPDLQRRPPADEVGRRPDGQRRAAGRQRRVRAAARTALAGPGAAGPGRADDQGAAGQGGGPGHARASCKAVPSAGITSARTTAFTSRTSG